MFSNAVSKRKGFLLLSVVTALIALLAGVVCWNQLQSHSVQALREQLDQWLPLLAGLRWAVIGSVALAWPYVCCGLAWSGRISRNKAQQLKDSRWRMVGWLVVIELVLGQGVLIKLTTFLIDKTA